MYRASRSTEVLGVLAGTPASHSMPRHGGGTVVARSAADGLGGVRAAVDAAAARAAAPHRQLAGGHIFHSLPGRIVP